MKKNNDFSALEEDFIQCCAEGNIDKCKELLKKIPKNVIPAGFLVACNNDRIHIVKLLVSRGFSVKKAVGAFYNVCYYGYKELATYLLDSGAAIDYRNEKGTTGLSVASERGHTELVALLLARGANPNIPDKEGFTALQVVCESNHYDIAELLLYSGAAVNAINDMNNGTALYMACHGRYYKLVELLLNHGAKIDAADKKSFTLLSYACKHGDYELAELLLARGADVNASTAEGYTALHVASQGGHYALAKLLLEKGANPNVFNSRQFTPLLYASQGGYKDLTQLLLDSNADIHAINKDSITALHLAGYKGHKEVAELLLMRGADINALSKNKNTPLYCATNNGHDDVLEFFLKHGPNVNIADITGWTPLHIASQKGNKKAVALLLNNNANVHAAENKEGLTALHSACSHGDKEVVELLLNTEINVHATTAGGFTALHSACFNGHKEVTELLLDAGINIHTASVSGLTALHSACSKGHKEVAKLLLARGADLNALSQKNHSPLLFASENGHVETVKLLLAENNIAVDSRDAMGATPLFRAVANEQEKVVALLLEAGANVNVIGENDFTILYIACDRGCEKIVALLLKYGADINVPESQTGFTPLHIACYNGNYEVAKLLLAHGALPRASDTENHELAEPLLDNGININAEENSLGFTALHIACNRGDVKIVKLLLAHGANANTVNKKRYTALDLALDQENNELAALLLQAGAEIASLSKKDLDFIHKNEDLKNIVIERIIEKSLSEKTIFLSSIPNAFGQRTKIAFLNRIIDKGLCWDSIDNAAACVALFKSAGREIVNKKDSQGNTLFHVVHAQGNAHLIKEFLNLSTLDKSLKNVQIEPKKKTVNAAFIESYFSSVLPKGLKLTIDKQNDFYVLSLVMNGDALENEDITFIRDIFNTECKNIFQGIVDNDCVKIATNVEEPLIQKSKIPYEKIATLKKRYTPAEVQIQFDDKGSFLEISTRHLSLPNTEEGKALWIEAVINDLAKIGVKATKDGKYQCKVPLTSLASSAMNFETPWFYSLLNTLSQRFFAAGEITKTQKENIAISFFCNKTLEFGTKSTISFSAESAATFLKYALKEMLTLDNLKVRGNPSKTKFGVIIPQSIEEKYLLEAKVFSFSMGNFANYLKTIRDFYSLTNLELCWCEESQSLGIVLFPKAEDMGHILRHLKENGCEVEVTDEKTLMLKKSPDAALFKGDFHIDKKRYTRVDDKTAEIERQKKEKQERDEKLNGKAKKVHASGNECSSNRPVMKPMSQMSQPVNTSCAKVTKEKSTGYGKNGGGRAYSYGHMMRSQQGLERVREEIKEKFMQIKGRYSKYKDSFYAEYDTLESDKQIIYYQFYLHCLVLFNDWYEYLKRCESLHQRHNTPFDGKADDMMKIRLCLSYSAAKGNMSAILRSIFKQIGNVNFDGANILSTECILASDAQKEYLTLEERVSTIVSCFTTLSSYVKGENSSQERLGKYFRGNPSAFHTARSLMVASVQLYREFPEETKMAKDLKPYKALLGQDLIPLRNNIVHNNPVEYTEEEVAGLIIQLYKAGNPTEKKPPVEKPQVKRPQTKKALLEKSQPRRPLAEITPVQAAPPQVLCTVRGDGLHVYTYEEAESSSSSSQRRPGYR